MFVFEDLTTLPDLAIQEVLRQVGEVPENHRTLIFLPVYLTMLGHDREAVLRRLDPLEMSCSVRVLVAHPCDRTVDRQEADVVAGQMVRPLGERRDPVGGGPDGRHRSFEVGRLGNVVEEGADQLRTGAEVEVRTATRDSRQLSDHGNRQPLEPVLLEDDHSCLEQGGASAATACVSWLVDLVQTISLDWNCT
jgi:hypothetical protein